MQLSLPVALVRGFTRLVKILFLNPVTPIKLQRMCLNVIGGFLPLPKGVKTQKGQIAGLDITWFKVDSDVEGNSKKANSDKKIIFYCHGGAFCIGSVRSHRDLCAHLAKYSDMDLISVEYGLAPEIKYPVAHEQMVAVYQELLAQGYQSKNIAIAGDSAGGNLAFSTLFRLQDKALSLPKVAYLLSPVFTADPSYPARTENIKADPLLSNAWIEKLAALYFTPEDMQQEMQLLTKDWSQLPPALIQVGSDEILLDDSRELYKHYQQQELESELSIAENLWHVYQFTPSLLKPAREALKQGAEFIKSKV